MAERRPTPTLKKIKIPAAKSPGEEGPGTAASPGAPAWGRGGSLSGEGGEEVAVSQKTAELCWGAGWTLSGDFWKQS